jgi:hypothetical protein
LELQGIAAELAGMEGLHLSELSLPPEKVQVPEALVVAQEHMEVTEQDLREEP